MQHKKGDFMDLKYLIDKVNFKVTSNLDNINKYIESLVAYDILKGDRKLYEVDHSWDPPWDWSGHLVSNGNYEITGTLLLKDYLDFYTGESKATYCSGYGLYHSTKEDWLCDELEQCLHSILYDVVSQELRSMTADVLCEWCKGSVSYEVSLDDFLSDTEEYFDDICSAVIDEIEYDTLAGNAEAFLADLPITVENPSLKVLSQRYFSEVTKIESNQRVVGIQLGKFIATLKEKLPDTQPFFKDRVLTKQDKVRLAEFYETFSKEEIALIAYFEPYRLSRSLRKSAAMIERMISCERERLESLCVCEVELTLV